MKGLAPEAADLRGINTLMMDFFDDPVSFGICSTLLWKWGSGSPGAKVDGRIDLIGVGDAAASLIGPEFYEQFVWPFEKRLIDELRSMGVRVRLHICGNTRQMLSQIGKLGCDIVDLDFNASTDALVVETM